MNQDVIVYLIRGTDSSIKGFLKSLALLKENFLPWSPADILVFHEANLNPTTLEDRLLGLPVRFAEVDFSSVPAALADIPASKRGYRHMCHFFSSDIFLRPELKDYRYEMRLDDDSYILSPLKFNVFETMAKGGFKYGYRAIIRDKAPVCEGLWPTARAYFEKVGCARSFSSIRELNMYYTNFELCDLAWFRGPAWQKFFSAIESSEGIWRKRWGDAPIRYLGVQGLLKDSEIHLFKELHYFHQSEWRADHARRLPHDLLKYYLWLVRVLIRNRINM